MGFQGPTGGGAAICAVYGLLARFNIRSGIQTSYKLYLPLALSCAFRTVAFATYASFWQTHDSDLMAVWGALGAAGYGIVVAMCSLLLAGWVKNVVPSLCPAMAAQLMTLARSFVFLLICFGPILGATYAGLMFGSSHPSLETLQHALAVRETSAWGFLGVLVLMCALLGVLTLYVLYPSNKEHGHGLHTWRRSGVLFMWPVLLLLVLSSIFRVVGLFHSEFTLNPDLYFPLTVTPEVLATVLLSVPYCFAQVGLGGRLEEYRQGQLPWQQAANSSSSSNNNNVMKSGDAEQGMPTIHA